MLHSGSYPWLGGQHEVPAPTHHDPGEWPRAGARTRRTGPPGGTTPGDDRTHTPGKQADSADFTTSRDRATSKNLFNRAPELCGLRPRIAAQRGSRTETADCVWQAVDPQPAILPMPLPAPGRPAV